MIATSTAAFYDTAGSGLAHLRRQAERLQEQVATGARLARPSDDPVASARLRTLSRQQAFAAVDREAADRAAARLAATAGSLGEIANTVIRARELALQAANPTASDADRRVIGAEIAALYETTLSLANGTDSTGTALFGGTASAPAYIATPTGAQYQGTGLSPHIDLGDGQSVRAGVTGPQAFDFDPAAGLGAPDLFAALRLLADGLQAGNAASADVARDSLTTLDHGLSRLTAAQTIAGARHAHVETIADVQASRADARTEEQGRVGGTDLAETIARLQQTMTVLEASQASFVRLSGLSLFDLLR